MASELLSERKYGEAIMILFQALDTHQRSPKDIEEDLVFAMNEFTRQLVQEGRVQNATWLWLKCLELSQEQSALFYYSYSRFLLSLDKIFEAFRIMERAILIDPNFVLALEGIENMKALVLDQWHFRMINDRERNEAYDLAIQRAIQKVPNAVVLDIGGGTGLLSMYAARAGAAHVYCCEVSPHMVELARRCVERNGFSEKITIIEAHSTDLYIASERHGENLLCALPQRVSIIVTELVDSGLLGEHIVSVLRDASERLLTPDGIVIPHGAEIFAVPGQCEEIAHRQCPFISISLARDSWAARSHSQIVKSHCQSKTFPFPVLAVDEDYTCESYEALLSSLRFVPLSDPVRLGYLSFLLPSFVRSDCLEILPIPGNIDFEFPVLNTGTLDTVATWFTLYLESPSLPASPVITTAPSKLDCGWDQAFLFLPKPSLHQSLTAGDTVRLTFSFQDDQLKIVTDQDPHEDPVYWIGEMDMALLNSYQMFESFMKEYVKVLSVFRSQPGRSVRIVELCNSWRSLILTEYIDALQKEDLDQVERIVQCSSEQQCYYLNHLLAYHCSAHSSQSPPYSSPSFPKIFSGSLLDHSSLFRTNDSTSSVIICDVVEGCGLLKQNIFNDLSLLYHSILSSSSQIPLIFPDSLSIKVALLEHPTLWKHSRIQEINTAAVSLLANATYSVQIEVASLTNPYGATMIREADLHGIPFPNSSCPSSNFTSRFLSMPQTALTLQLSEMVKEIHSSNASPVISSTSLRSDITGTLYGVALWYSIHLSVSGESISTGPEPELISNNQINHYWRQVVFLSATPVHLVAGTPVEIEVIVDRVSGLWCRHHVQN